MFQLVCSNEGGAGDFGSYKIGVVPHPSVEIFSRFPFPIVLTIFFSFPQSLQSKPTVTRSFDTMLISRGFLACGLFLQGAVLSLASPLSGRSNSHHLKCTNAPNVVAGYYVDPKDAQPPDSTSATCQAEYQYLYCIPGTYTYIFFGTLKTSLQSSDSYATALNSSITYIDQYIGSSGDGILPNGHEYITNQGTGVLIYAEDANKHHLTWGVFGVALQGLNAWMADTDNGYSDATFQISDGKNEVGNGYIGAMDQDNVCVFANAAVPDTPCVAVDSEARVYGNQMAAGC